MVARRRRRRAGRRSARPRLVSAAAARLGARAVLWRRCSCSPPSPALSELALRSDRPLAYLVFPALGLGRAALRAARRHAGLAVAVGFAVWNTTHYHGPFVVRLDHAQRPQRPALHRRGGAVDAVPRRAGLRAQEVRRAARRVPRPADRGVRHRAATTRAQPPRRRPAAPDRARIRLGLAARSRREAHEPGAAGPREAGAEVVLAIDELRELAHGIHPAVLTDFGLAPAIRPRRALDRAGQLRASCPRRGSTTPPRRPRTTSSRRRSRTRRSTRTPPRCAYAPRTTAAPLHLEIADDGIGGAAESAGGGLTASATASRRSAAPSTSTAPAVTAPASPLPRRNAGPLPNPPRHAARQVQQAIALQPGLVLTVSD